jgi:cell division protein FtsX
VKFVSPIALFSGGMLVTFALLVAMALGIQAYFQSNLMLPQPLPPSFATSLAQASNLEGMRQACAGLAMAHDAQVQTIRGLSAHISHLFNILSWGIIGVGCIVGSILLYIYFATRRHGQ